VIKQLSANEGSRQSESSVTVSRPRPHAREWQSLIRGIWRAPFLCSCFASVDVRRYFTFLWHRARDLPGRDHLAAGRYQGGSWCVPRSQVCQFTSSPLHEEAALSQGPLCRTHSSYSVQESQLSAGPSV